MKIKLTTLFIYILILYLPLYPKTTSFKFDHISLENGLSQSTVFSIAQDKTGFIWFATMDGLNRYDGYDFSVFKHTPFDSTSLSENFIRALLVDKDGKLWVGTDGGGLNCFNPVDEKFKKYPISKTGNTNYSVYAIKEDENGDIWFGTDEGLFCLNPRSNLIREITFSSFLYEKNKKNKIKKIKIISLIFDSDEVLWIGTENHGLFQLKPGEEKIFRPEKHIFTNELLSSKVECILEDNKKDIWIGTEKNGLLHYDRQNNKTHFFNLKREKTIQNERLGIRTIIQTPDGVFWVGTRMGLYAFSQQNKIVQEIRHQPSNMHSISDNSIMSLFTDNSGIVWIGTWAGGVNKYSLHVLNFKTFKHKMSRSGLGANIILSFFEDEQKNIYVGSNGGGIYKFDKSRGEAHPVNVALKLNDPVVQSIAEDKTGKLWMGTWKGGINCYDPVTKKMSYYQKSSISAEGPVNDNIHTILADSEGDIWFGTAGGLCRFLYKDRIFEHFNNIPDDSSLLHNYDIWALYEDSRNRIWVGTFRAGVSLYNPKTQTFTRYQHSPKDSSGLSNNNVWCIYEDNSGKIWMGTSAGLNTFNEESGKFTHYFENDGLPNNCVYGILEDNSGYLWLSTNGGLSRFDASKPEGEKFRNFDLKDGLQSNEFNMGAYYKCKDGELLFGGINGFSFFNPGDFHGRSCTMSMVITKLKILNEEAVLDTSIYLKRKLKLPYGQNSFSVEFSLLDYANTSKNQYKYKLRGLDKEWSYSRNMHYANYTNLDPGEYVFIVKGANHKGIWSEQDVSLKIIVTPPFWESWWFRGMIILIIIIAVNTAYRMRVRRLIDMERLRIRIASDLHDDIGSSLTHIAIYSEMIQTADKPEKVLPLSQKIGNISRDIISTMSDVVWSIDARNDKVKDLIDRMHNVAFTTLNVKNIKVEFSQDGLEIEKNIAIDIRQNIFLIFKEAVNNIAKHSNAAYVNIS
ncbi:MAG: hypothetical protein KAR38_08310, partial [Calditrichia bacterium]|nr:hypothetical protein [Calditrichia bacterium]